MSSLALFDLTPDLVVMPKPEVPVIDVDALENLAFLYTATATGSNSGIRFMASVEDAKKWCSSDVSKGAHYDAEWHYQWTSVLNFIQRDEGYVGVKPVIDISGLVDNGSWDSRIEATGCRKVDLRDFRKVLEPLGVEVKA